MSAPGAARGARPVASLDELAPAEALLVRYLRHWCESPEEQAWVWNDMALALGVDEGRRCLEALEDLVAILVDHGRRPLMRHHAGCRCVGGDEAVFANFVTTAALGERDEAMMIATLLVRPTMLGPVCALAQALGLGVARIALRTERTRCTKPPTPTRH